MIPKATCPACGSADLQTLYHQSNIPTQSVVLLDSREEALAYPLGEMTLTLCHRCGLLFNATFDSALVDYSSTTEESQHFSGTFNRFARDLASEIVDGRDLQENLTLEIGCGKGDFLEELVRQSGTRAIGVDPGFIPERYPGPLTDRMHFIREYFDPSKNDEDPDLIICRHTLEHIEHVRDFMEDVVTITRGNPDVEIVFETPDVARVLAEGAFWDIYHEHCSYFTIGSHARLFRSVGLDVQRSYLAYDAQYIIQYAKPGQSETRPDEDDLADIIKLSDAFPQKVDEIRSQWSEKLDDAHRKGKAVAIWGGGSKGVSFLCALEGQQVTHVIDINEHKQGKYVPGTGHVVSAPEALLADKPDIVIVMNPIYVAEIEANLTEMGLSPELLSV